jgi:hypothetical protein
MSLGDNRAAPEPMLKKLGTGSEEHLAKRRARRRRILAASLTVTLFGAAAVAVNLTLPRGPPATTGFIVDVVGERFVIRVTDPETIRLARENLNGGNDRFPAGKLATGDGGFNAPWSWHLRPDTVRMVENAIELCDGRPSHVEQDLTYWVETVGHFCPWSGRIVGAPG